MSKKEMHEERARLLFLEDQLLEPLVDMDPTALKELQREVTAAAGKTSWPGLARGVVLIGVSRILEAKLTKGILEFEEQGGKDAKPRD
jgi:hypothetical protein